MSPVVKVFVRPPRFGARRSARRGRRAGIRKPCMGPSKSSTYFTAFSTCCFPVSLFDLEARFFVPTHTCWTPARTGAVKAGRRSASGLTLDRFQAAP
jgi:hypothetical protein